jgi:hypothetical protein
MSLCSAVVPAEPGRRPPDAAAVREVMSVGGAAGGAEGPDAQQDQPRRPACAVRVSGPGRVEYRSVDAMVNPYLDFLP